METKAFKNNSCQDNCRQSNATDTTPKIDNPTSDSKYGLSTNVALGRLADEIEKILTDYEQRYSKQSSYNKLRAAFIKRHESPLNWYSIATTLVTICALLVATLYLTALTLTGILLLSLFIVVREHNFRQTEIYRKTRRALEDLRLAEQELCEEWRACNYAHICCPMSPCVSLQWTYRDGVIVNLPWALLVKGDYIVLRPGHIAPGPCTEIHNKRSFKTNEMYGVTHAAEVPIKPVARTLLPNLVCCLEDTPYIDNLKLILENSHKRPPTIYNQQRYLLVTKYLQQWGFISSLLVTILSGILNICGFRLIPVDVNKAWYYILIESTAAAVIPLLPLIFPIMWISMNLWGVARLQCFLKTPQLSLAKDSEKSFEEDLDTPIFDYENINLQRSKVIHYWFGLWRGDSELLPRSANVVQVLGSITALCCVDKKGILSWPNPTAEKVFFLHDTNDADADGKSDDTSMNTESDLPEPTTHTGTGIVSEVLDLTHDQHCPFRLEFDDHEWKAHIKSLKPLGLAILLNTCSPLTHAHYAKFCGHVTAVAITDKDLVPVTNRYAIVESTLKSFLHGRCLCELAKQIGFTDHATDRFALEGQLASYRHLQPDGVRRDMRFARQLQLSSKVKVKVPFPHALSVVMRENPGGYLSLFTQGTADILLDCCDDFWDGKDLRPLSSQDRKSALDFYQRSALTAYCTAFAYRPLRHGISGVLKKVPPHCADNVVYLEFPPETNRIRLEQANKIQYDFQCGHAKLSHSISTDSLLFSEGKEEDISDVEGCYEMQSHQVFIGMVTMQYQAQMDIVQLVEHMERACIRFVHFSKENELRSRVFSEKMGLESGWNCHISLLSENNDKQTQSPRTAGKENTISHNRSTNINPVANITDYHANNNSNPNTTITPNAPTFIRNRPSTKSCSTRATELTTITTTTTTIITTSTSTANVTSSPNNATVKNILGGPTDSEELSDVHFLLPTCTNNLESTKTLSSSAPGAISNLDYGVNDRTESLSNSSCRSLSHQTLSKSEHKSKRRQSQDSALDENCHSVSILTESTEPSAPVLDFDMSNRAKLPRGIENIRPHLETVDNVPLQVSLFTDCSAEATREMLEIMQSYGEIVVCMGSSASNSNAEIFLQADCSIAVEPLYPQVCQDIAAYTEINLSDNKLKYMKKQGGVCSDGRKDAFAAEELLESGLYGATAAAGVQPIQPPGNTISPIYLSRLLNSLPCSIAVKREDPLSLVAIIELSRRFSSGLWNCIQFWASCAGSLSALNMLSACLSVPCILTPLMVIYIMCIPVPLISFSLAHIDLDKKIMNRATGKKQTEYDTRVFGFVIWCYGCKFMTPVILLILPYLVFLSQRSSAEDFNDISNNLQVARSFSLLGILLHYVVISTTFVHRDHSLWQRNPLRNRVWTLTSCTILLVHVTFCVTEAAIYWDIFSMFWEVWPAICFLYGSCLISLTISEMCKWQEIKVNARYQRRARLDFGTKLGMNSPF